MAKKETGIIVKCVETIAIMTMVIAGLYVTGAMGLTAAVRSFLGMDVPVVDILLAPTYYHPAAVGGAFAALAIIAFCLLAMMIAFFRIIKRSASKLRFRRSNS